MEHKALSHILKFEPILKEKIWGGTKLHKVLNKASENPNIGESWEISDVEGDYSVVNSGPFKGKTLKELLEQFGETLVGKKNYTRFGNKFPLLIKFIDAKEDLSVQLHPDDIIAKKKHNSLGKTEMWHIVQADPNANIIIGFNQKVNQEVYQKHVTEKDITAILNYEPVTEGDTFFVYSGLIHAIGKGVMLAEIQQTSDITYRVYDWDRTDANGNSRELHQEEALEAIDFTTEKEYKVQYNTQPNELASMVKCEHFTTNVIEVAQELSLNHETYDSFVIYMCVKGEVTISSIENEFTIKQGETVLVPASINNVTVKGTKGKLLQVYV
ncbi:type I phosphomannose isomerase catalytic subunit [Aquimarina rhabdastrellae]